MISPFGTEHPPQYCTHLIQGVFQTNKVQTKAKTKERNMRMAMVKQQAFIFRTAEVHNSLEKGKDFMLKVFSLVRYLKGLLSFVLYLNAELVFATSV